MQRTRPRPIETLRNDYWTGWLLSYGRALPSEPRMQISLLALWLSGAVFYATSGATAQPTELEFQPVDAGRASFGRGRHASSHRSVGRLTQLLGHSASRFGRRTDLRRRVKKRRPGMSAHRPPEPPRNDFLCGEARRLPLRLSSYVGTPSADEGREASLGEAESPSG